MHVTDRKHIVVLNDEEWNRIKDLFIDIGLISLNDELERIRLKDARMMGFEHAAFAWLKMRDPL